MPAAPQRILLTNDDGIDSPLLAVAAAVLAPVADLFIAVPAEEQSWKGKSMTRFSTLRVADARVGDLAACTVTGTPADCVNLATHTLMEAPPDLVVSGINIGINTGLGFLLASGTVGGCLEGNVAGIPGLALSQHVAPEDFHGWEAHREFDPSSLARLDAIAQRWIPECLDQLIRDESEPVTWSVNFPLDAGPDTQLVQSHLGHTFYSACFVPEGDGYRHRLRTIDTDQHPLADGFQVMNGNVAATRIDLRRLSDRPPGPPEAVRINPA